MDNNLWKEAVKTEYDGMKDITKESLKDVAVIGASLKNSFYAKENKYGNIEYDKDSYICKISAFRFYDGKECTQDNKIAIAIEFYKYFMGDKEEYDRLVLLADGQRIVYEASSQLDKLESDQYFTNTDWLTQKHVINGLADGPKKLGSNNAACKRTIVCFAKPETIKFLAESETDLSLYVDKETMIYVNGGDIKFTESAGSFHIEGLPGFMKRVYHFFVDETCYTDYCNSYYENKRKISEEAKKAAEKAAQKQAQKAAQEELERQEAIKHDIKMRNIWIVVFIVSLVFFVLSVSLEWENDIVVGLSLIFGVISFFKIV